MDAKLTKQIPFFLPEIKNIPVSLNSNTHGTVVFILPCISLNFSVLMTIRDTGSDFASDIKKKHEDPILRGEKDSKTGHQVTLPDRDVGPSSTQVQ